MRFFIFCLTYKVSCATKIPSPKNNYTILVFRDRAILIKNPTKRAHQQWDLHFTLLLIRHPPDAGLLTLRLRLSTDFGNANPPPRGSRAPKPATSARRAPKMRILLASRRASPLVFDRTQNNQALHVERAASGGRSSAISRRMSANKVLGMATSAIWKVT